MLSIGLTEILLIATVAILVVGPDRLPKVMRQLGRWYGQLRRAADELRRAFVLEADRQDAEERYSRLQERRREAVAARSAALAEAGEGTVVHEPQLPDPDPDAVDAEVEAPPAETADDAQDEEHPEPDHEGGS